MHVLIFLDYTAVASPYDIDRSCEISKDLMIGLRSTKWMQALIHTQWNRAYCSAEHSIDQSHRYGRPQAACREPAGSYDKTARIAICFEHKTQYLLIRDPYTRIVVFWHISNIPLMISQSQISCNIPTLYIAAIFVTYCYTTGSWLLWLMS